MSEKASLSRRSFMKGAILAGTVTAGSGVLVGCSPKSAEEVEWDREADVIVVGSGTGQMAAIRAASEGLNVIVLEKAPVSGGTTGISGGGLWIPNNYLEAEQGIEDSREMALEYLSHATFGQGDPDLYETYVDTCNEMIQYLRDAGVEWEIGPQFQDYYPMFPGGVAHGRHIDPVSTVEGATGGGALVAMLREIAEDRGAEYLLDSPAKQLVVDSSGKVAGVIASIGGADTAIKANRGVVIASGGFDHNEAMVNNFLRGPVYYPSAVSTNTGDGHLMGMAIGADLRNMNEIWGWPVYFNPDYNAPIPALAIEIGQPGAIVVNKAGKRFLNESGPYDLVTRAFYTFDTGTIEYSNIPGFVIADSTHRSRYTMAYTAPGEDVPEWIAVGDTLEDLAAALEIDAEGLLATVEAFNANAAEGVDPEFHRGESAFDQETGADPSRDDLVNKSLAPIAEGPFYGAQIWPGALGTCGGLHINTNAQVLDVWGEPIVGLYAVGNAAGSPMGAGYPGGGATVGTGMTFGYIAAGHMAAQEPAEG